MIVKEMGTVIFFVGFVALLAYSYITKDEYEHDNYYEEGVEDFLEQKVQSGTGIPMKGKIDLTPSSPERGQYYDPRHENVCPKAS